MNKLKPVPKHPSSLRGGYKYKEEREADPSSSQSCLQQLHVSLLFLLPNGNLNQISRECPFERVRERNRVETLSEGRTTT
jgi:hypothetical protein